jgi:amino acid transporter
VIAATVVAVFDIRVNAWVTGVFLVIELLALGVLVVLGFAHADQPVSTLFDPTTFAADGSASAVTTSALVAGVAIAVFALNGYGSAVQFGEEITGPRRTIARCVLWALGITAVAEVLPLVAVLIGTPSLAGLVGADNPFSYFVLERGGDTVNTIMSLAVAGAVFNALIAIQLELGRGLFSAGRDRAFPGPVNRAFASVHGRHGTPWIATLALGAVSALLVALVSLDTLLTLTGAGLVVGYALIATSALVFRMRDPDGSRHYRMPLWPMWPALGLAACVMVFTQQTREALVVTAAVLAGSALYYLVYLLPRRGSRWVLVDVAHPEDDQ